MSTSNLDAPITALPAPASEESETSTGSALDPSVGEESAERSAHTRISAAWAAVFIGVLLGVALIDFVVENTRSVRISFFSATGSMPVAVALLAAALAGAAVVLTVGVCRTAQLRLTIRRHRRPPDAEALPSTGEHRRRADEDADAVTPEGGRA